VKSRLVAGAALLILSAAGAAATDTVVMDGQVSLARPLMVIPPQFPKGLPPPTEPVEVSVRGVMSAEGRLLEPVVTAAIGNEAFARAVSEVVADWRFIPAIDRTCRPVEQEALLLVWFGARDGAPTVHVSTPSDKMGPAWPRVKGTTTLVRKTEPRIEYPARLNYAGIEGIAVVLLKVARSGEVLDASLRAVSPVDDFGYPALRGLQRIAFEPFETEPPGLEAICGEYIVNYCISYKDVRVAHPHCDAVRGKR